MCNKKTIILLNVIIPILIGAIIYYFFSPNVLFVRYIDDKLGIAFHFVNAIDENEVLQFVRYYFLDMLWAYALVFALYGIMDNNSANLVKIFLMTCLFSTVMELLQITPLANGTFDMGDVILEMVAEVIAVFIIKKHIFRRSDK